MNEEGSDAPQTAQEKEQCASTFGGPLAPVGFGVRCERPAGHPGLHRGGGGAWMTWFKVDKSSLAKAGKNHK